MREWDAILAIILGMIVFVYTVKRRRRRCHRKQTNKDILGIAAKQAGGGRISEGDGSQVSPEAREFSIESRRIINNLDPNNKAR